MFRIQFARQRYRSNARNDCYVSAEKDNNAWMAQVLVQGTNFLNFMGKYIYVAAGSTWV